MDDGWSQYGKRGLDVVQQDGTIWLWYEIAVACMEMETVRRTRFGSSLHNNESVPTAVVVEKKNEKKHLSMKIWTNFFSAPEDLF